MRDWYVTLTDSQKASVDVAIDKLHEIGHLLGRPHCDTLQGSAINLKELRAGETLRIFFKFDPRGVPILLSGGNKKGQSQNRWYENMMVTASELYKDHLVELHQEGLLPAGRGLKLGPATTRGEVGLVR